MAGKNLQRQPGYPISFAPPLSAQYHPDPEPGDILVDRYCAWDERGGHQWFKLNPVGPSSREIYIWYDDIRLLDPNFFWPSVKDAIANRRTWIHLTAQGWTRCDGPSKRHSRRSYLLIPIPLVPESYLQVQRAFTPNVQVVRLAESLYVCKRMGDDISTSSLQNELENYIHLRESPYIVPLKYGVQNRDGMADGFLMPYLGGAAISDPMWRWSSEEKVDIMLDLFDAVLDFEHRGVVHTDLKCHNVILTNQGLKLIDLHRGGTTRPWRHPSCSNSPRAALHTFGRTVWEIFTGVTPWDIQVRNEDYVRMGWIPPVINDIVYACSVNDLYKTVQEAYDGTQGVLSSFRRKRIGTARLVMKHEEWLRRKDSTSSGN